MTRTLAAAAVLLVVLFVGVQGARSNHELMGDFRAFYCAGELAREHAFSYDQRAIAPCESQSAPGFYTAGPATSLPAPLPGYVVAFFEPFSLLPFVSAAWLWGALSLAAIGAGLALAASMGWMRLDAGIVLASVLAGAVIVPPGELGGIAFAGVMLLAYGCERDIALPRIAGLFVLALEPQIALCVWAALIWRSERRRELFVAVVVLGAATLLAIGPQESLAYVRDFLPAHVASELHRAQQYTIGWALAQAGLPAQAALWAGRGCYALAVIVSALIGRKASGGHAIAAAAALSLALGPFVHLNHFICALPAALVVGGPLGTIAALLVAFPPTVLFSNDLLIAVVPVAVYWVVRAQGGSARAGAYGALAAALAICALAAISERLGFSFVTSGAQGNDWAAYVARHDVVRGSLIWIVKAPVWAGVLLAAAAATALAVRLKRGPRGNVGKCSRRGDGAASRVLE